jgi:hypothetical protein
MLIGDEVVIMRTRGVWRGNFWRVISYFISGMCTYERLGKAFHCEFGVDLYLWTFLCYPSCFQYHHSS